MKLDDNMLKKYCEDNSKKGIPAIKEPEVVKEFLKFMQLNQEFFSVCSAYDAASLMRSYGFWHDKKDSEPKVFSVNPKEVYYVDLGAFNLKYEEGFLHSCIIVKRYGTMVLVIPGSSKKFKKGNFLIEDVVAGDGFRDNTGVMIDQLQCVSITRIRGKKIGEVKEETFKRIENKILEAFMPEKSKQLRTLVSENNSLKKELEEYKKRVSDLEEQVKNNQNKIECEYKK